ncbi:MAG TPA: SDR family oxidoreductase, partial [Novosphingobium sp.]|nr:SDR family oxidoreductase [Novosphingobium sp.]
MPMKVAVITGSTQGIGHALALALRELGYGVVISCADGAEAACVAAEMGGVRNGVVGIGCDVTRADEVQALWEGACEFFGQIDVWVNNAGLALTGQPLALQDEGDMRRMLDVNVMGTLLGTRTALAGMSARGGGAIYNMLGAG